MTKSKLTVVNQGAGLPAAQRPEIQKMPSLGIQSVAATSAEMIEVMASIARDQDAPNNDRTMAALSAVKAGQITIDLMRYFDERREKMAESHGRRYLFGQDTPMARLAQVEHDRYVETEAQRLGIDPSELYAIPERQPPQDTDEEDSLPAFSEVDFNDITTPSDAMIIIDRELAETEEVRSEMWASLEDWRTEDPPPKGVFIGPYDSDDWPSDPTIWHPIRDRFVKAVLGRRHRDDRGYIGTDCGCRAIDTLEALGVVYVMAGEAPQAVVTCGRCAMSPRGEQLERIRQRWEGIYSPKRAFIDGGCTFPAPKWAE